MGIIDTVAGTAAAIEDEPDEQFQNIAQFTQNSNVINDPIDTGGELVNAAVGSDDEPPQELVDYLDLLGYEYYDNIDLDKACSLFGLTALISEIAGGSAYLASLGNPVVTASITTGAFIFDATCEISDFIEAYNYDILGCGTLSNAFIFVNWYIAAVYIVPFCSSSEI